ncbi:LysR family transcriptional regulator [Micromonospora sp. Llam7]|nr:LysR family transcriptional regulator [Micromonospora tarapacensis]
MLATSLAFRQAPLTIGSFKDRFMLDVRRLRILCEVARHGSFTGAARALAYTPSAVSQQVAILEREVNTTLVERGARGATLTEPGRLLVRESEEILTRMAIAEAALQSLAAIDSGLLRIGWFATAGAYLVPQAIAEFRRRHPGIRLELSQGDPDECIPKLLTREIELALVYEFEPERPERDDLHQVDLIDDPLHIGLPESHPLAKHPRVRLADLAEARWIQGVWHGATLDVLPRACRLAGFEPAVVLRTDDRMTLEGLVAAGVGVALVPRLTLPAVRRGIAVRPLDASGLFRRVRAAIPATGYRSPAALAMVEILRLVCADLIKVADQRLRHDLPPVS